MKKLALISLTASATLFAGGYKIPESSLNAMALSAAYIANAHGADASYYNPANMAFETRHALEVDATYIGLGGIDFDGSVGGSDMTASSKSETFLTALYRSKTRRCHAGSEHRGSWGSLQTLG